MELKTIIYTTSKDLWIKRDFDKIYESLKKTRGITVAPFEVRYIKLPENVPIYTHGGVYINWDWLRQNCPPEGNNNVCLHISTSERDKLGLKHPDPKMLLGGVYNNGDKDPVFDFVVIADKNGRSYSGLTEFERLFIHELSHGFAERLSVIDYTHLWDQESLDIRNVFWTYDFTKWNNLVEELKKAITRLMNSLKDMNTPIWPVGAEWKDKISQGFGVANPIYPLTGHHVGIDIAMPTGEKLFAISDGEINLVQNNHPTMGNMCFFRFSYKGQIYVARYMHAIAPFKKGVYKRGDIIGHSGDTGAVTGPHLHLDIFKGEFNLSKVNKNNWKEYFINPSQLLT